jgi:hypothetical protein
MSKWPMLELRKFMESKKTNKLELRVCPPMYSNLYEVKLLVNAIV